MSDKETGLYKKFANILWLMHSYTRRSVKGVGNAGANPHQGQGRVLALLKLQPEISQKDLAFLLNIRPQSLGELLAKLERSGYITRTVNEDDRRAVIIRLTDEGRKAAEEQAARQNADEGLFDCLTPEEQQILSGYLDRIIDSLGKQAGEDEPFFMFDGDGGFHGRIPRMDRVRAGFMNFDWAAGRDGFQFGMRHGPCGPAAQGGACGGESADASETPKPETPPADGQA